MSRELKDGGTQQVAHMYGGNMKDDFPPGTAVTVHMDDGCNYLGQVMFRHFGDPDRVMVAWIGDSPSSGHDIADWVEAWRCSSPQTGRPNSPGGGLVAGYSTASICSISCRRNTFARAVNSRC